MRISIKPDGRKRWLWDDRLAGLAARLGPTPPTVTRASHVEPAPGGGWLADLAPSGGPVLGPFALRGEALEAEAAWLRERL